LKDTITVEHPTFGFGVADTISHYGYFGSLLEGQLIKVDLDNFQIKDTLEVSTLEQK
jgi:hypothetical protein